MPGTTRKHASGSGLPCPAHRLQRSRPLPAVTSAAFYSEHTPPHTAFETPDGQGQAPGTNPAAAVAPALFLFIAIRVSWLEDVTLRFDHGVHARQSTTVALQTTLGVNCKSFQGPEYRSCSLTHPWPNIHLAITQESGSQHFGIDSLIAYR